MVRSGRTARRRGPAAPAFGPVGSNGRQEIAMWHKILIGFDGSDGAKKAFSVAVKLASQFGAELHSISIEEKLPHYAATVGEVLESKQEAANYFRKLIAEAQESASAAGVTLHSHVMPGHEA